MDTDTELQQQFATFETKIKRTGGYSLQKLLAAVSDLL